MIKHHKNLTTPLEELLSGIAGTQGILIEGNDKKEFMLLPMDDKVLDLLLERSPELIKECEEIRARIAAGEKTHSLDDVMKMFGVAKKKVAQKSSVKKSKQARKSNGRQRRMAEKS